MPLNCYSECYAFYEIPPNIGMTRTRNKIPLVCYSECYALYEIPPNIGMTRTRSKMPLNCYSECYAFYEIPPNIGMTRTRSKMPLVCYSNVRRGLIISIMCFLFLVEMKKKIANFLDSIKVKKIVL